MIAFPRTELAQLRLLNSAGALFYGLQAQRTPALVWKSARGEYAVEDLNMNRWYEARVAAGTWPPQGQG